MNEDVLNRLVKLCSNPDEAPFGQWINSLFSFVDSQVEMGSMVQKKELFLQLLGELMDRKIVVVFPPEELYQNGTPVVSVRKDVRNYYDQSTNFDNVWDTTSAEVVKYITEHWPEGIKGSDDPELNMFWYGDHCPRIGWYDPLTDSVIAS